MANGNKDKNQSPLEGGTQPEINSASLQHVGGPSGGSNSIGSQVGGSQPDRGPASPPRGRPPEHHGTANRSSQDAAAAFEGEEIHRTRRPSESEAKQRARDEADSDTTCGTPYGGIAPEVHKMQGDEE